MAILRRGTAFSREIGFMCLTGNMRIPLIRSDMTKYISPSRQAPQKLRPHFSTRLKQHWQRAGMAVTARGQLRQSCSLYCYTRVFISVGPLQRAEARAIGERPRVGPR